MSKYQRYFVPGGTYFFTLVTHERRRIFQDPAALKILGNVFRDCAKEWPFKTIALVVLHDHLHAMWSLPRGDTKYSTRWGWIKKEFSKAWRAQGGNVGRMDSAAVAERRLGIWQRRFWEHTIEDETDFDRHFHYIHYNPVKHGYVKRPIDWPHSTIHRWVEAGVYSKYWASGDKYPIPNFKSILHSVGE